MVLLLYFLYNVQPPQLLADKTSCPLAATFAVADKFHFKRDLAQVSRGSDKWFIRRDQRKEFLSKTCFLVIGDPYMFRAHGYFYGIIHQKSLLSYCMSNQTERLWINRRRDRSLRSTHNIRTGLIGGLIEAYGRPTIYGPIYNKCKLTLHSWRKKFRNSIHTLQ